MTSSPTVITNDPVEKYIYVDGIVVSPSRKHTTRCKMSRPSVSFDDTIHVADELAAKSLPGPNTLKYLFRAHIPVDFLYDVLDKICVKKDKYYIIDFNAYRLLQFHDLYTPFAEQIIHAYKPSKQKYVTRTLTYNSFTTIVRHICRINGIPFETKFNYQHSLYNIDYYIYYTYPPTPSMFPPL